MIPNGLLEQGTVTVPADTHIKINLPDVGEAPIEGSPNCTNIYDINSCIMLFDSTHDDVTLAHRVKREGYPNVYGARIPVKSNWNLEVMSDLLQDYPDKEVVEFLRFGWPANRLPGAPNPTVNLTNHKSATEFPEFINNYLLKELQEGASFGPFDHIPFQGRVGVSPMSTREKRDPSKRRVIMDLKLSRWCIGQ